MDEERRGGGARRGRSPDCEEEFVPDVDDFSVTGRREESEFEKYFITYRNPTHVEYQDLSRFSSECIPNRRCEDMIRFWGLRRGCRITCK